MNIKILTLAAVAAGVAIVTFVALNLAAPITHATEEHPEGVTAEQVFAASIAEPGASAPRGAGPSAAQADTATPAASSTLPSAPTTTEVAMVADAPAAAPAAATPVAKSGSCLNATVDPAAAPVVVTAAATPAGAPADTSTAAAPKVADAPSPEAAPKVPEAAPKVPEAAPKIADAPRRKAAPTPKPSSKPSSKPPMPKSAPAEARTAWWPAKAPGKLNLVYAGEASFTKAIVLLFDGPFDNGDSANQHVKVTTGGGETVKGKWLVATGNPRMLLFNVGPGLYRLDVGSGMTDKDGRAISAASGGLVFVP